MIKYEDGYLLPYITDYIKITPNLQAYHGKVNGEMKEITLEEAAKRAVFDLCEANAWNISSYLVEENPKTPEAIAMKSFAEQVGLEALQSALDWCESISYEIRKQKMNILDTLLEREKQEDIGRRVR